MEQLTTGNNSNKRTRVDTAVDSPESKRANSERKLSHDPSELDRVDSFADSDPLNADDTGLDSPEAKQKREDILDILDEPDAMANFPPEIQDLDSVMKSFEEEILHGDRQTVLDLTSSDSGDSQPDLGYLLEASDDELGLPPSVSPAIEHVNAQPAVMPEEAAEFGHMIGFEDEMPNYDTFDLGIDNGDGNGNGNGDFVTVGGLFDYPEPSDFSEYSWRQESLPAL